MQCGERAVRERCEGLWHGQETRRSGGGGKRRLQMVETSAAAQLRQLGAQLKPSLTTNKLLHLMKVSLPSSPTCNVLRVCSPRASI